MCPSLPFFFVIYTLCLPIGSHQSGSGGCQTNLNQGSGQSWSNDHKHSNSGGGGGGSNHTGAANSSPAAEQDPVASVGFPCVISLIEHWSQLYQDKNIMALRYPLDATVRSKIFGPAPKLGHVWRFSEKISAKNSKF